jgi:phosphoglycerate dehydrogenase-like enzyme
LLKLALAVSVRDAVPAAIRDGADVFWYDGFAGLLEVAPHAEAIWLRPADITSEQAGDLIARAQALRWLHISRVGIDALPLADMARRGVLLTNGTGLTSHAIAEHVVMCMLALRRGLPALVRAQQESRWAPDLARRQTLAGSQALILGYGHVGQAIAERARGLGVRVIAARRQAAEGSEGVIAGDAWRQKLPEADFLVVALPLTPSTSGLIGEQVLAAMKPGAVLVNVARGEIVDEEALVAALAGARLGGAILDCFRTEPLPAESSLWRLPNAIVTPHVAWYTDDFAPKEMALFADNFERFLRGAPMVNTVDMAAGY